MRKYRIPQLIFFGLYLIGALISFLALERIVPQLSVVAASIALFAVMVFLLINIVIATAVYRKKAKTRQNTDRLDALNKIEKIKNGQKKTLARLETVAFVSICVNFFFIFFLMVVRLVNAIIKAMLPSGSSFSGSIISSGFAAILHNLLLVSYIILLLAIIAIIVVSLIFRQQLKKAEGNYEAAPLPVPESPIIPEAKDGKLSDETRLKNKVKSLGLPVPPEFLRFPGCQNVGWVKDGILVFYFDYVSGKKEDIDLCLNNDLWKIPVADILYYQVEGSAVKLVYSAQKNRLMASFPSGSELVFDKLIPGKAFTKPGNAQTPAPSVAPTPTVAPKPEAVPAPTKPAIASKPAAPSAPLSANAIKLQSKINILGLPVPPIFDRIPNSQSVTWFKDGIIYFYYDYLSDKPEDVDRCIKNNPWRIRYEDISFYAIEGSPATDIKKDERIVAFHCQDNGVFKKFAFPLGTEKIFDKMIPEKSFAYVQSHKAAPVKPAVSSSAPATTVPAPKPAPMPSSTRTPEQEAATSARIKSHIAMAQKAFGGQPVAPSSAPVAKPVANSSIDIEARLLKLKALFDKKLITQEEYDRKRDELLSNM